MDSIGGLKLICKYPNETRSQQFITVIRNRFLTAEDRVFILPGNHLSPTVALSRLVECGADREFQLFGDLI